MTDLAEGTDDDLAKHLQQCQALHVAARLADRITHDPSSCWCCCWTCALADWFPEAKRIESELTMRQDVPQRGLH